MEVEESASISTAPSQAASQSTSFTAPAPLTPSDAAWSLLDLVLDTIASLCASLSDGSFTPSLASFLSLPLPLALLQSLSTIRSLLDAHIQDKEGIKFLPHRAMCSLFAVEKVLESVNDVMTASKYALEERHMSTASLHPDTLPVVRGHLTWQLEAVQGVSSVVQQGGGAGEAWRVLDAVGADLDGAQISLKASVFTSAQCSLELLHAALQISCHQSMIGGVSVEEVRDLAGQQVRWLQLPQLELLSCVVSNITTLANVPLPPFFPANLHALLTNALLNKAASPQSFSLESVGKNQADNVARSTLFCLDITVNSVIDLHSSDEPEYLATFSKLKALEKLTSIGQDMLARYETAKQRGILTGEDVEKVEETLENLSNFIEYKQQFVGK
ncbi:hypothetical protein EON65_14840 [archaeon]|nr:MAG: hypothetical protein EON65_14840 [archaeon]